MRRSFSRHTLALAALAMAPAILSAQQVQGRSERIFTVSERVADGGAVRLFMRTGNVTITEGSGSTVEFRAEKDPRRGKLEDVGFVVLRGGDGVTICAVYRDADECDSDGTRGERGSRWNWNRRESLKLTVTVKVPRGTMLQTNTGNGDVSVTAAVAEARISSGNGRLLIDGVRGRVDASSGNGDVSVERAGGPVRVSSGNGDVTIGTVSGPVNASSGNGDIRVSMDRLSGTDDMEFSSGNGRVLVTVPADFSAEVEANTGNGKVSTDFPITVRGRLTPSRLRGTIGNGGRRLRMSSGNGAIEILKKM